MTSLILDSEPRRAHALKVIRLLPLDRPKRVTIEDYRPTRSTTANARLWALHTLAANKIGCSPAELHEDMLCEFYGYSEVKMPSGVIRRVPLKRSSTRDTKEFSLFMEFCETFYITKLEIWLE